MKGNDPHVVLDSNKISGTVVDHEYSPNGEFCAFTIINEAPPSYIHVLDVETGESIGRSLKFEKWYKKILWSADSKGFFVYVCPIAVFTKRVFHFLDEKHQKILRLVRISAAEYGKTAYFFNFIQS